MNTYIKEIYDDVTYMLFCLKRKMKNLIDKKKF